MWTLVALGALTWLVAGLLVAAAIGRSIRLADQRASAVPGSILATRVPTPTI